MLRKTNRISVYDWKQSKQILINNFVESYLRAKAASGSGPTYLTELEWDAAFRDSILGDRNEHAM